MRIMRIMRIIKTIIQISHRVCSVPQYPWSHVAARLKGDFRHICTGGVHKNGSQQLAGTDNTKFSAALFIWTTNKNDNSSNLEVLYNLDYGIDELGVFKSWTKILCIDSANYENFGFMLQISLHHIQLLS